MESQQGEEIPEHGSKYQALWKRSLYKLYEKGYYVQLRVLAGKKGMKIIEHL